MEERKRRILLYQCQSCDHQGVADSNRVYRKEVQHSAAECTQVLQGLTSEPTLPRTRSVRCAVCGHGEAVYSQATSREEGMTLFCLLQPRLCGHRWRE